MSFIAPTATCGAWWRSLSLFLCYTYSIITHFPHQVAGAALDALLGGKYVPTTDVEYIVDLTELLEAIAYETSITDGIALYKKITPDGISLESITVDTIPPSKDGAYLDAQDNPLYSIYMYAFWRSHNGSGKDPNVDQPRDEMNFLGEMVDNYGHTIILDQFQKGSGYDANLTAETIRVTNLWMATVQSLYDAVDVCEDNPELVKDPTFINPIDQAAAFWFGNFDETALTGSGSLYAWAERIRSEFSFGTTPSPFDANKEILEGLNYLQTKLKLCKYINPSSTIEAGGDHSLEMRKVVDKLTKVMTVPLVQNLIHHTALVASSPEPADADSIDYMILYGLVALPSIVICDKYAYDSLYNYTITHANEHANEIDNDHLYDMLVSLYSRLICLGIKCDYIGTSKILENVAMPTCLDPSMDLNTGYPSSNSQELLEFMQVDLDIRTIGTLIEMEASYAAYDVYHWGMHGRTSENTYLSVQAAALEEYHPSNTVGRSYNDYFAESSVTNFADKHEYKAILGREEFADATTTQQRIITESSMVLITLHAFAINHMYNAIDICRNVGNNLIENNWDRAFASLTGWAEEDQHSEGFLLFEVARYLCTDADSCNVETDDSEINRLLMAAFKDGKTSLEMQDCDGAQAKVVEVQKLLLTALVDLTAFFAEVISLDLTDADNFAEGYGVAIALVPLMQNLDPDAAGIIERSMGVFGSQTPFVDGLDDVFDALSSFVTRAGIDCTLLSRDISDDCDQGIGGVPTSSGPVGSSPIASPPTSPIAELAPTLEPIYDPSPMEEDMTSNDGSFCGSGIDGGVPSALANTIPSSALLGGAYTPTSNVNHIVALTDLVGFIERSESMSDGLIAYEASAEGISLKCLSIGSKWIHVTTTNPLYVIYMYGLWISDEGDNDVDGYSNKMFDEGEILNYGDTIVMDEFEKSSGYDGKLTGETIRVTNMWMATTTEMYRAAESCRDGYDSNSPQGFNPVDFAAAFWFGSAQDADSTDGGSLYAWAKRAEQEFTNQSNGANAKIISLLRKLQQSFADCRGLSEDAREVKGIEMKHAATDIARWMVVPLVQNFIHHLAAESGMEEDESDERNRMVLYALTVLPFISICDEDTFDDLFYDLVTDLDSYDSATFTNRIETLYSRFECLGISCDMVGKSIYSDEGWPECIVPSTTKEIAGYLATSDASFQMLKFDLDISTIFSFIVMEASEAALDIYENGRNVKGDAPNSFISLKTVSIPSSLPEAIVIYEDFTSGVVDYTSVTKNAIMGEEAFLWSSPLKNSAAASLAIATIDMHLSILDDMHQAVNLCETGGWEDNWDSAVAAVVGWTEGDDGSSVDGYLFFQLAEELCAHFDNCENDDGESIINNKLMAEFTKGQESLKNKQCEEAEASRQAIERYLQAILVDILAYHSKFAHSNGDDRHCLLAHVARNALLPLIRRVSEPSAKTIEDNVVATALGCRVDDVEAVYMALNDYVVAKIIDCSWLGSSVCKETIPTFLPTPSPPSKSLTLTFRPTSSPTSKKPTVAPTIQKTPTASLAPSINMRFCGLSLEEARIRCVKSIPCPDGRNDNCLRGQTCFSVQRICDTEGSATNLGIFSPSTSPTNNPTTTSTMSVIQTTPTNAGGEGTSTASPTKKPTNKPIMQIPYWDYDPKMADDVGEVDGVQNHSSTSLHSYSMDVVVGAIAVGGTLYVFM